MSRARGGGGATGVTAYVEGHGVPEGGVSSGSGHRTGAEPGTAVSSRGVPLSDRVEGLLLGLAAGDAAGWPAARHRAARMPEWTRRLTRELDTFAEQNATTTLPVPIALNQPPNRCASAPRTTPSGRRSRRRPYCGRGTTACWGT
ncbi:hypothetical protein SVIOM342S_04321 [Streptomyces violaceorubidus]